MNGERLPGKASEGIGWSYEAVGVFAAGAWYICNQFHAAFPATRTECDIDAGELQHDFLKAVCDFEQARGQFERAPDKGQIGFSVTIG